jgi:hypothetical protein
VFVREVVDEGIVQGQKGLILHRAGRAFTMLLRQADVLVPSHCPCGMHLPFTRTFTVCSFSHDPPRALHPGYFDLPLRQFTHS